MSITVLPEIISAENDKRFLALVDQNANVIPIKDILEAKDKQELAPDAGLRSILPATHRMIIEKKIDCNGARVTIRGDEASVRSIIDTLNTYPPKGPVYTYLDPEHGQNKLIGFSDKISLPGVAKIGKQIQPDGKHIKAIIDGKSYTGSGNLVIFTEATDANAKVSSAAFVALFRDSITGEYADLGGRIPKTLDLNENILLKNANKEAKEESAYLVFANDQNSAPLAKVDISTNSDYYRSYIYYFRVNTTDTPSRIVSLREIRDMYIENIALIATEVFGEDYKETNGVTFFRLDRLVNKIKELGEMNDIRTIAKTSIPDYKGNIKTIRGRTIRVLDKLQNSGEINSILSKVSDADYNDKAMPDNDGTNSNFRTITQ